jgi:protein-disulfide isomerase
MEGAAMMPRIQMIAVFLVIALSATLSHGQCVLGDTTSRSCVPNSQPDLQCRTTSTQEREAIIRYVKEHYEISGAVGIQSISPLANCYSKVVIAAEGALPAPLYLSPDHRFLFEELMDTSVDPVVQRRQDAKRAMAAFLSSGAPSRGPEAAPVTIAVFSDFECPYCKHFEDLLTQLPANELRNVRYIFLQLPIPRHSWAKRAAELSICASEQNAEAFWAVHDFLFREQGSLSKEDLDRRVTDLLAARLHLDLAPFDSCMREGRYVRTLSRDLSLAVQFSVNSTPTVFINGKRDDNVGTVRDLHMAIQSSSTAQISGR